MFFNSKIQMLYMAENLNAFEILTKHFLFVLRFYQVKSFLSWHQRDIWWLKLIRKNVKRWKIWKSAISNRNASDKYDVHNNTVSTWLKTKGKILSDLQQSSPNLKRKFILVDIRTLTKLNFNEFKKGVKNISIDEILLSLGFSKAATPTWFESLRLLAK